MTASKEKWSSKAKRFGDITEGVRRSRAADVAIRTCMTTKELNELQYSSLGHAGGPPKYYKGRHQVLRCTLTLATEYRKFAQTMVSDSRKTSLSVNILANDWKNKP